MMFVVFANSSKCANDGCNFIIFLPPSSMVRRIEGLAHRRDQVHRLVPPVREQELDDGAAHDNGIGTASGIFV